MKKLCLMALAIIFGVSAHAQEGIRWVSGSLDEAIAQARTNKKGPKFVFADLYTPQCGPCKYMAEKIFPTKEAGDYFNARYINIKLDLTAEENRKLGEIYQVAGYPTFLVLDGEGNIAGRLLGSSDHLSEFISRLEKVFDPERVPAVLLEKYLQEKTTENAEAYLQRLDEMDSRRERTQFIQEHFQELDPEYIISRGFWNRSRYAISLEHPEFMRSIIRNKIAYDRAIGKQEVDNMLHKYVGNDLLLALRGYLPIGEGLIREAAEMLRLLGVNTLDDYSFTCDLEKTVLEMAFAILDNDMDALMEMTGIRNIAFRLNTMEMGTVLSILYGQDGITEEQKRQRTKEYTDFLSRAIRDTELNLDFCLGGK